MPRLTIDYPEGMEASNALSLIGLVAAGGRVSGPPDRKQFCYVATTEKWVIYSDLTRRRVDAFRIEPNSR